MVNEIKAETIPLDMEETTMERTYAANVRGADEIKVCGFVDTIRNKSKMAFIVLKDITGKVQVTVEKNEDPELDAAVNSLTPDSVITVIGKAVESEYVKLGGVEIYPKQIIVESIAAPLPIDREARKGHERSSIDQRIDYRWVDLRTDKNQLLFKVQTCLIGAASESGADVFEVDYFDRKAYLAQSPQFYKQMAMASGLERIFEVGPVFRAEKSYTSKHTTEFTGFDLEFSYIESFRDVMKMEEDLLTYALTVVKEKYGEDIERLFGIPLVVPTQPFPIVTLKELYDGLEADFGYTVPESEKGDLTTEAEKLSFDWVKKHYDHEFLFVTDYAAEKRAFYHMRDENGVPQGYDLIWRGVEITTGAQREHRYDVLKAQAEEKGLAKDVEFYLEFFRYGCPPHGGFGLGVDRLTMLLLGMGIKEVMFLFRGPNRLTP